MGKVNTVEHRKSNIRWELAEINSRLNKELKTAVVNGPMRLSTDHTIHDLRSRRDVLLAQLESI